MATTAEKQAAPWLEGRAFALWREEFDRLGYLIFERVLPQDRVADIRAALAPHLARDLKGRNDFEGVKTNRVYALLAKSPVFAGLVAHPLAMAFVEAELGESCLLSALLAINLQPGETVQPWHFDDSGAKIPRPRPATRRQHVLGDRRHHRIERGDRDNSDEPSLGQRHHRGRGEAYRFPQPRRQVRDRRPRGRDQDDDAVGVAGDHQGSALAPWRG